MQIARTGYLVTDSLIPNATSKASLRRRDIRMHSAPRPSPRRVKPRTTSAPGSRFYSEWWENGAPEEIRTPDPQIRSLVLYPAELRARFSRAFEGAGPADAACIRENNFREIANAGHSYRLARGLARSGNPASAGRFTENPPERVLSSRPLVADAQEFHRPIGNRNPERGADGTFHQMDVAAMGADQFGGDRKPKSTAAGPP